ncbi:Gfo/Idh/MocA family oxidoreductase [Marinilongibacter aquaticus]|uniref:Gfo/Idh/MocA family protein n=1 Tax=Marinilongibacter aquaticus TaxID=2975157 RepID=UPI0021BD5998|nr:Gfo/Idh/MocA family oxidoreductase [Marinilongibacter aquaticus]UBM60967.1 Gfo/Idh/MocA family oxidoreductase [Marinilongibacter aquaticus]
MLQKSNRRDFIKQAGMAGFGFYYFPNLLRKPAPSDRVRVAHIGINGMGTNHMRWFAGIPEVDIVALCDLDRSHLEKAASKLKEWRPDAKPDLYADFRKVLERKDIDAISCATPDHWHAQVAILAFQAGKDVYGEKPLSFSVKEGEAMLKSQKETNRIFQLGTQIHAGDNYHRVVELIRSGELGKIKKVHLWKTGKPPVFEKATYQPIPEGFNWDFWQGPAPEREYFKERSHFSYRYFMDYSGGVFQDFWCHIADIVWWSLAPEKLKWVEARGPVSPGIGDTPESLDIDFKFKGLDITWSSTPPNLPGVGEKHIGAYFEGSKGSLVCDYGSKEIHLNGQVLTELDHVPQSIPRSPGHQQNFVDSVKSRVQPESNLAYAKAMTEPMHLALISWELGKKLKWDWKKAEFKHDAMANAMLHRPYRKGYDWVAGL